MIRTQAHQSYRSKNINREITKEVLKGGNPTKFSSKAEKIDSESQFSSRHRMKFQTS